MTRAEALPIARKIVAAVHDLDGSSEAYGQFTREGAYDDGREMQIAIAALTYRHPKAEAKVVEIAA